MNDLLEQLEQWNENDEFSRCIEAIEAIPEKERGYKLTVFLGRAYSNLAVLGDHNTREDDEVEPDNPEAQKLVSDCEGYLSEEPVEMYDEADWDAVEEHITKYFGHYEHVFHEIVSTDIHLDICVIPPRKDHNYYTLVTFGMGAHRMNVPEELSEKKLERAELLINLPPDWKLSEKDWQEEKWYWPIDVLKWVARLPIRDRNTWKIV